MPELSLLTVAVAAIAAFIAGSTYYALLGPADGGERPQPWKLGVEVGRCLLLSAVVAGLAAQGSVDSAAGGLVLGLALWLGFPFVLWTGALPWERTPLRQAVLHGGDWLVKLLVLGMLVSVLH